MHVFMTGASGWIGGATVPALLAAGHTVSGLARSDEAADRLRAVGVDPQPGSLDDLDTIRAGAAAADATIHLANLHDWGNPAASNAAERGAVEAIAETLLGSQRPFLFASGVAYRPGTLLTEDDASTWVGPTAPRGGSEALAMTYVDRGVGSIALRFAPTVHGAGDHGFIAAIADVARRNGVSAYVGDGDNAWSAVHRDDAGRLVAAALTAAPGTVVHAVAEEAVATRVIAEGIGAGLGVPVRAVDPDRAGEHFGWIGTFFGLDLRASSALTRQRFDWEPDGPTLVEDLAAGHYTS